jgi:hypothetical protein
MLDLKFADTEFHEHCVIVRLTSLVDPYNFETMIQQLEPFVHTERPEVTLSN